MKAIIIDDEQSARVILNRLLTRVSSEIEVVAMCEDLPIGVESIKKHKPDVVFIDVQMPEYAGFEISSFFDSIDFELVFVTAHNEFAIKAFELSAIDYLLKPVQIERIRETISRLTQRVEEKQTIKDVKNLAKSIASEKIQQITLIEKGVRHVVELAQIEAFQAQQAYTLVHLVNGKNYLSTKHLKHFERYLENDSRFFRSHKSWIINLNQITNYVKADMSLCLSSSLTTKLSRYRVSEFEARMTG